MYAYRNLARIKEDGFNSSNAVELFREAIAKTVEINSEKQLSGLVEKLEEGGKRGGFRGLDIDGILDSEEMKAMLKQAAGLAKYMGHDNVVAALQETIQDPLAIVAIKDDAVVKDVLKKILVMRKMAEKSERKQRKLKQLESNNLGSDDESLKEFLKQTEELTKARKGPEHSQKRGGGLKKSKSFLKKSRSMIMSAKDIPMNAFMAIKSGNEVGSELSEGGGEKWLQNFLSESIVEEVPWECSNALILLKDGFQVRKSVRVLTWLAFE